MRLISFLLFSSIFVVICSFEACKKDDSPTQNTSASFTGTWELTKNNLKSTVHSSPEVVTNDDTSYAHGKSNLQIFNADSTYRIDDYTVTPPVIGANEGTYLLFSDHYVRIPTGPYVRDTVYYSISGNTMNTVLTKQISNGTDNVTYIISSTFAKQ